MSYEFERTPSPKETLRNVPLNNPSYTDLSSRSLIFNRRRWTDFLHPRLSICRGHCLGAFDSDDFAPAYANTDDAARENALVDCWCGCGIQLLYNGIVSCSFLCDVSRNCYPIVIYFYMQYLRPPDLHRIVPIVISQTLTHFAYRAKGELKLRWEMVRARRTRAQGWCQLLPVVPNYFNIKEGLPPWSLSAKVAFKSNPK